MAWSLNLSGVSNAESNDAQLKEEDQIRTKVSEFVTQLKTDHPGVVTQAQWSDNHNESLI